MIENVKKKPLKTLPFPQPNYCNSSLNRLSWLIYSKAVYDAVSTSDCISYIPLGVCMALSDAKAVWGRSYFNAWLKVNLTSHVACKDANTPSSLVWAHTAASVSLWGHYTKETSQAAPANNGLCNKNHAVHSSSLYLHESVPSTDIVFKSIPS